MVYDTLIREAKDLSEDMLEQVIEFISFLKYVSEKEKKNITSNDIVFERSINPLAGELVAITDDFDETPECFKEYV